MLKVSHYTQAWDTGMRITMYMVHQVYQLSVLNVLDLSFSIILPASLPLSPPSHFPVNGIAILRSVVLTSDSY